MTRSPLLLLDANVWIDNYCPSRPNAVASQKIVSYAVKNDIDLLYPITALGTIFYVINSTLKHLAKHTEGTLSPQHALAAREFAWSCIENLQAIASTLGADQSDAWLATKYRSLHNDLEDDLILASAQQIEGLYLVTNDVKLRQNAPLPALDPASMLTLLNG